MSVWKLYFLLFLFSVSHSYTVSIVQWDLHGFSPLLSQPPNEVGITMTPVFQRNKLKVKEATTRWKRRGNLGTHVQICRSLQLALLSTTKFYVSLQIPYKLLCINFWWSIHEWAHWCEQLKPQVWGLNFTPFMGNLRLSPLIFIMEAPSKKLAGNLTHYWWAIHPPVCQLACPCSAIAWPIVPNTDSGTQPLPGILCYVFYGIVTLYLFFSVDI